MYKLINKDYYNKLLEFVFSDTSIETEMMYNNGLELNPKYKDLLQRYTKIEYLYNNMNSSISKEEADKIRNEYKRLKNELYKLGFVDLNKDNRITTISKYIGCKEFSSKAYRYMELLGFIKDKKITDFGKWFSNQLVKYPNFTSIAVDDNNIDIVKNTLLSLYNNKVEIKNNSVFSKEFDNIKILMNTEKEIKK